MTEFGLDARGSQPLHHRFTVEEQKKRQMACKPGSVSHC